MNAHPEISAATHFLAEARGPRRRIVITTMGSLGDLHPYLALALELKARGHHAIVGTGECYRAKIESLGLGFRPVRPDCAWIRDPDKMRHYMHLRWGLFRLNRELLMPHLREMYDDTLAAADGADLLVSQLGLAARLVAEKTGIAWASTIHMPLFFFSAHDVPLVPLAPNLFQGLRRLGPRFWRPVLDFSKRRTRFLARPWYRLRNELGLPPTDEPNPLGDTHSPSLVLALFSKLLAEKQPDWPAQTVITGFPDFKAEKAAGLPAELANFLDAGTPPIVFTMGTAVASNPGTFYWESAMAAKQLGRRAVLILNDPRNRPPDLPDGVMACNYAPFGALFPRAAAVVHHGGIGTTGLCLHSGRPMLVMPCAWDQPDNAARAVRLGVARSIPPAKYRARRVAAELGELLDNPAYAKRAQTVAAEIRKEDGTKAACDALEQIAATGRQYSSL